MSAEDPIDVDEYEYDESKLEKDYCAKKVKPEGESGVPEPELSFKLRKRGNLAYARSSNRRHPEDADALVDSGGWNTVTGHFPNVSLQTLKKRYANMKAKLFKWTPEENARLLKSINRREMEIHCAKMGMTIKACKYCAEKLGLK